MARRVAGAHRRDARRSRLRSGPHLAGRARDRRDGPDVDRRDRVDRTDREARALERRRGPARRTFRALRAAVARDDDAVPRAPWCEMVTAAHVREALAAVKDPEIPTCSITDRKSTRLNSSHRCISYAVFCLKK